MIFPAELFARASFRATDIAVLFGVSRTTGMRWLRGDGVHKMARAKVARRTEQVRAAVQAGALPLKEPARGPARHKLLTAALLGR